MGFDNSTIKPFRDNKPHICFRDGFWRVSSFKNAKNYFYRNQWFEKAHYFVNKLNQDNDLINKYLEKKKNARIKKA